MPGTAISARSTTTGPGCAAPSRRGWWTSPTRSRWACAGRSTTPGDWTGLRDELGLDYLTTEDVFALGPEAVAQRIRERVGDRPAFITFDIDVVDPAYAPGTGTPEAGGPSARDMLAIVRRLTGHRLRGLRRGRGHPRLRSGRARLRRWPRTSPTRCCRWSPSSAAQAADGDGGSAPAWKNPMPPGFSWPAGIPRRRRLHLRHGRGERRSWSSIPSPPAGWT